MKITRVCPICGKEHAIEVDTISLHLWMQKELLLQDAFPEFNPLEREFVKSGYCPECQALMFGSNYSSVRLQCIS